MDAPTKQPGTARRLPPSAKWTLVVAALAAAVALGAYGFSRLGEETPERAIYALGHDWEHSNVADVCERLFPRSALPPAAAATLDLPARQARNSWDVEHRRCLRDFGRSRELSTLDFEEPRVRSIRRLSVEPEHGVTQAARAQVALAGDSPTTVNLVEFRGKWRVVFDDG